MRRAGGPLQCLKAVLALSAFLIPAVSGCKSPTNHFFGPGGQPFPDLDYLWREVDKVFPGALPAQVTLVQVGGPHSSFMIESNSIGIPSGLKNNVRRGKICRQLTHLALHRLSGGDRETRGHCFDNDVVFLEQAAAGYLDRRAAGMLEQELDEVNRLAAQQFRQGTLNLMDFRDWESFYYRGYWSDQYKEWNLEGLRLLTSLGDYFERNYGLSALAPVFELLAKNYSLDEAVKEVFNTELDALLAEWRDEILAGVPEESPAEPAGETSSG